MTKKFEIYYLLLNEEDLMHTIKNKKFIEKIMFLVIIVRLRINGQEVEIFSKKIDCFRLT